MKDVFGLITKLKYRPYDFSIEIINEIEFLVESALPKSEIRFQFHKLLAHIIKKVAYCATTARWEEFINDAIAEINSLNKRDKAKGYYFSKVELKAFAKSKFKSAKAWVIHESEGILNSKKLRVISFDDVWEGIEGRLKK